MKMPPPDELGEATDRLVRALKALVPEDRHEALDLFGLALSDWCAVIIGRAASQSASAFIGVYTDLANRDADLERKLTQTNRRIDRKQTKEAGTRTAVEDLRDRVEELERVVGSALRSDNGR